MCAIVRVLVDVYAITCEVLLCSMVLHDCLALYLSRSRSSSPVVNRHEPRLDAPSPPRSAMKRRGNDGVISEYVINRAIQLS